MIIVPDIHGRDFWRTAAEEYADKEPVIFLGDYIDPFSDEGVTEIEAVKGLQDIVLLKKNHPDSVTLLLGNHDLHYVYRGMAGSRFDHSHAGRNRRFFEENADLFQLAHEVSLSGKKYLLTHAGILPGWLKAHSLLFGDVEPSSLANHLNDIWRGDDEEMRLILLEALSDVSISRWGMSQYGSLVWADVSEHDATDEEIPGYYQVFGHTRLENPVITRHYACLDCRKAFHLTEAGEFVP